MSELRIESWSMPAADLGPDNPLPPFGGVSNVHALKSVPDASPAMLEATARGHVANCLPYTMQDGYGRRLRPRVFRVAVLENEWLCATFLLELGGRLWSLVHKPSGRELLEVNPVFQPANLALRNAWFSGGVEWNIGLMGHSPFTCAPLFAARAQGQDGTPILRLYEWERVRQVPFQIDAYLPDGSPVLYVHGRIANPHDRAVPMYWWSNIAVPETPDTRVLAPADEAYSLNYGRGGIRRVPIPEADGRDVTYSTRLSQSADFFFRIPEGCRPWITALDGAGKGLAQVSTERLRGRKLFAWGTGPGGKRWQSWLSRPGHAYIEVQAGLARTQMEYRSMPAGAEWAWLEAYGLMEADPAAVHGADWMAARGAVEAALDRLVPPAVLDREQARAGDHAVRPIMELIQRGAGWGALERHRRQVFGERPFCSGELMFDDASLSDAQRPWLTLLREGTFPGCAADAEPGSYLVQAEWRALLEHALSRETAANWLAWLHLGVMRYYAGDRESARLAWERSLEHARTPWALRNIATLDREDNRFNAAADGFITACRMRPSLRPLAVECGRALLDAGRPRDWLNLVKDLPPSVRVAGRIRLLEAWAALETNNFKTVEAIMAEQSFMDDLQEGETSFSDLWFNFHARRLAAAERVPVTEALRARVRRDYPVPPAIDFRMSGEPALSPGYQSAANA